MSVADSLGSLGASVDVVALEVSVLDVCAGGGVAGPQEASANTSPVTSSGRE